MNRSLLSLPLALLLTMPLSSAPAENRQQAQAEPSLVLPSAKQQEWAAQELGVLFHFDMPAYVPEYNWRQFGTHPPASAFNPSRLDTDQWIRAARDMGARYAVLVAKHCSGFSLWPTEAHEYSIKNSPWKNGRGDLVADFLRSCKKYGLKPGLYASTAANGFCHVDNPGKVRPGGPFTQQEYNKIVETQLTELWSRYGELFEIWFDGGVLPPSEGGADVSALLKKYQPRAIAFQGPETHPNLIRWVGNEEGLSPYPCWATAETTTRADGTIKIAGMGGTPSGKIWCPGEADVPLRRNQSFQGGWFWKKGEDHLLFSVKELMQKYCRSVGRNTNMLLGIVIDDSGLIPEADLRRMREFGARLKQDFSRPLASASGTGSSFLLQMNHPSRLRYLLAREDISRGERILKYRLEVERNGTWETIEEGESIGHCRIVETDRTDVTQARLTILSSKAAPVLASFEAY